MDEAKLLPEHLREKVLDMPESNYGATRVVVILDDGTRVSDVHVAWGKEIVKVGQSSAIPFDASKIVDVEPQMER